MGRLRLALLGTVLFATGCGRHMCADATLGAPSDDDRSNGSPAGAGVSSGTAPASDAARAVAEADIIQMDGAGHLFAMSKSGTVAIVDVSQPGQLSLLGKASLSGQPFEMYLLGTTLVTMSIGAVGTDGTIAPPAPGGAPAPSDTTGTSDPNAGSVVSTLDISDPSHITPIATFVVPGEIADSRMVGSVLYVATYENGQCYTCTTSPLTRLTSFDLSDPTSMKKVDHMEFQSNAPDSYNLAWGMAWKRSILATSERIYIGGHADVDPAQYGLTSEGIIDVVDVTDPAGKLTAGARINVAGAVLDRWQMDETDGVFRVISQAGAGRTPNGTGMPSIETFTIGSTTSYTPLGHASLTLPMQEGLRTVRFDGSKAYAITFNQTDPLFTIDFSDPANPAPKGQLKMPGWMFYLEPHGDRLIGLGVDRTDPNGSLNVSLFDVSDLTTPRMLKRVAFGASGIGEDYEIIDYEVPEDQDRIQKAFKVFDDGRVAVPFSGVSSNGGASACTSGTGGIQLLDWSNDTLTKESLLDVAGNPRRAFELNDEMVAVSDSDVAKFSLATAAKTADVTIGTCVAASIPGYGDGMGGGIGEGDPRGYDDSGSGFGSGSGSCE